MKKHTDYTDRQLFALLILHIRKGCSLMSVCRDKAFPYNAVYNRMSRAGLIETLMAAKYRAVER